MRMILAATLVLSPTLTFAAGTSDSDPPTPTETTMVCEEGQVWDEKTETCVVPEEQSLNDDQRASWPMPGATTTRCASLTR
jgi:hypothetical protein